MDSSHTGRAYHRRFVYCKPENARVPRTVGPTWTAFSLVSQVRAKTRPRPGAFPIFHFFRQPLRDFGHPGKRGVGQTMTGLLPAKRNFCPAEQSRPLPPLTQEEQATGSTSCGPACQVVWEPGGKPSRRPDWPLLHDAESNSLDAIRHAPFEYSSL
jgi:hypothetical protein